VGELRFRLARLSATRETAVLRTSQGTPSFHQRMNYGVGAP
jgi:hypothetical protein